MKTILIEYTKKREDTLKRIKQSYEIFDGKLAIHTKHSKEFILDIIDTL